MEWLKGLWTLVTWIKRIRDINWADVLGGSDVRRAVILIAVVVGVLFATMTLADTRVYAGVGFEAKGDTAPFCHDSVWTGEFGIERDFRLPLAGTMVMAYEHNSCFDEEDDDRVSDRFMLKKVWTFK